MVWSVVCGSSVEADDAGIMVQVLMRQWKKRGKRKRPRAILYLYYIIRVFSGDISRGRSEASGKSLKWRNAAKWAEKREREENLRTMENDSVVPVFFRPDFVYYYITENENIIMFCNGCRSLHDKKSCC